MNDSSRNARPRELDVRAFGSSLDKCKRPVLYRNVLCCGSRTLAMFYS